MYNRGLLDGAVSHYTLRLKIYRLTYVLLLTEQEKFYN